MNKPVPTAAFVASAFAVVLILAGMAFEHRYAPSVYETALASTVRLENPDSPGSVGSGFVLAKDGRILTAAHVCEGVDEFVIHRPDGEQVRGVILWASGPAEDVCLIQAYDSDLSWRPVELRSTPMKYGDPIFVVGAPEGLSWTLTTGVVARPMIAEEPFVPGLRIQIDAVIAPGSSGGPLFDAAGKVVGMNVAGMAINVGPFGNTTVMLGFNFATPATTILRLLGR